MTVVNPYWTNGLARHVMVESGEGWVRMACGLVASTWLWFNGFEPPLCEECFPESTR